MKYGVKTEDLDNFTAKCDALCASKLILSDKKVSDILKVIAASEDFCKFMEYCLTDFNYNTEFLKAKTPSLEKPGKFFISLPENEKLVAFVFCLLCEFDSKERDLAKFLTEFYGLDELFKDGYADFCKAVIIPFKEEVLKLASQANEDGQYLKSDVEFSAEIIEIPQEINGRMNKLCKELIRNITRESRLKPQERRQYGLVVKAFITAAESGDKQLLQVLLISLLFMCGDYKFLISKVKQIQKLLEEENLLLLDEIK